MSARENSPTRCAVVAEGPADGALLELVLARELRDGVVRIRAADGKSSAEAAARTILGVRGEPVVLVADADTTSEAGVQAEEAYLRDALGSVARQPFEVVLAVPEFEVCFFHDRSMLGRLLRREVNDVDWTRGRYEPKSVLRELSGGGPGWTLRRLLPSLSAEEVERLRESPLIQTTVDAIGRVSRAAEPALA